MNVGLELRILALEELRCIKDGAAAVQIIVSQETNSCEDGRRLHACAVRFRVVTLWKLMSYHPVKGRMNLS